MLLKRILSKRCPAKNKINITILHAETWHIVCCFIDQLIGAAKSANALIILSFWVILIKKQLSWRTGWKIQGSWSSSFISMHCVKCCVTHNSSVSGYTPEKFYTSASRTTLLPSGQMMWSTWERTLSQVSSGLRRLACGCIQNNLVTSCYTEKGIWK